MARDLEKLAEVVKEVYGGRLSERAIVLLVWDSLPATGRPTRAVVQEILRAFAGISGRYIVKPGSNLSARRHVDVEPEE